MGTFALALLLTASNASAIPILDFTFVSGGQPGVVSYAGGAAPLVGVGLAEHAVIGTDTPLHDGEALAIASGLLAFQTGPATGGYTWGAGTPCPALGDVSCSLSIVGDVGHGLTTLLSGQLTSVSIVQPGGVVLGLFTNFVDAVLAAYFGLGTSNETHWRSSDALRISLGHFSWTGGAFACQSNAPCVVGGSDLLTTPQTPIPEPGSLLLVGSGVLLAVRRARRRRE